MFNVVAEARNIYVDFCQVPQLNHLMYWVSAMESPGDYLKYLCDIQLHVSDALDALWDYFKY